MGLASPLVERFNALAYTAGSYAWEPLVSLSRSAILALLSKVESGSLVITDTDGQQTVCGKKKMVNGETGGDRSVYSIPHTGLQVHKETFWVRLLLFADMAYQYNVQTATTQRNVQLFILNRNALSNGSTITSTLSSKLSSLIRRTNTLATSRLNIAAHYDISNAMFAAFLSPDMTYSCPIWLPTSDPKHVEETLEQAQERKLRRFITNAKIKSGDHVLEIGTGWGSFAIMAVRETGCRVTSLTLSVEQKELAEKRIAEAGFTDQIEILLCDYRALPTPRDGRLYDKVVSIEMLEAVGKEFLDTYFSCIDKLLKQEGGVAVFQCITMPESVGVAQPAVNLGKIFSMYMAADVEETQRYDAYASSDDFIRRYIFPGGHLPTSTQLLSSISRGSQNRLIPESIENIGPHYAKTLRIWRENFMGNFDSVIGRSLREEHVGMTERDVELFRRKWEYYFCYCEAGFATKTLGDVILTVGREGAVEMMEDVPL
ncbi:hypothetical protein LTR50_003982 [Elasticomyces elasticus]|nr:hypothetical protein LTR50_003982 [Elasticomyces elasticus]